MSIEFGNGKALSCLQFSAKAQREWNQYEPTSLKTSLDQLLWLLLLGTQLMSDNGALTLVALCQIIQSKDFGS